MKPIVLPLVFNFILFKTHFNKLMYKAKGYATRERFLKRIRQNPPNLRKILSRDGLFNEIVIARHAQLNRFSRLIAGLNMALTGILVCIINYVQS